MPRRNKLGTYRDKRDPARTNEPFNPEPLRSKGTRKGAFVVHLHDATRRHWDLRLEIGGALESFAVPRGPSLVPLDKRLAVQTETHPIDYLDFEAVIPEGNYGAGAMIIWDRGAVQYLEGTAEEGVERGKIDFVLNGHKLRGRFALVKTSGRHGEPEPDKPQWLLIKKSDEHARPDSDVTDSAPRSVLSGLTVEELPDAERIGETVAEAAREAGAKPLPRTTAQWTPMLCITPDVKDASAEAKAIEKLLQRPGWRYELKVDGVRILARRDGHDVSLRYRSGRSATESYPEVVRAVRALPARHLLLDGEIVAFDERGRPDFQLLGRRIQARGAHDVRLAAREVPVLYLAFDLLAVGDRDLRALPLTERRRLLTSIVRGKGIVRMLDDFADDGMPLWKLVEAHGLEGVIAKRGDSRYLVGPRRGGDWIKIKRADDDDFVVIAWTRGEGARDAFGALELASHAGERLIYRGRVGTGFDGASIDALLARLEPLATEACPAEGELPEAPRGRSFVRPEVVVSVRSGGWTHDGHLRHPVFRGVREDLTPDACTAAPREDALDHQLATSEATFAAALNSGRVQLTNQDKVFWPAQGYTKGQLCRYYADIAPALLPYLVGRPVLMVRYPDGIEGKHFYQWNVPAGTPDWVRAFPIRSEEHDGREVMSFLVDDQDTLLFVANLGAIPLHVLASRAEDLARCDFLTVDFDIGDAPFAHAIELARVLHELLDEIGLPSFPKTSGQTGLHVLVPLGGAPFATATTLAELLGRLVHGRRPDISTMERVRDRRPPGVVYIDTGQTGRSRAIVAPYSVRAYPGATVSTPLRWDEVGFDLDPARFTILDVAERVGQHGDPMRPLLDARPDIAAAVARLTELIQA